MQSENKVKKNCLLICSDVLGSRMAGPAIRYLEMAKVLSRDHNVILVAAIEDNPNVVGFNLLPKEYGVVRAHAKVADIVVFQGDALVQYPFLKSIAGVLIADMYCPIPLEYHQSSIGEVPTVHMHITTHLSRMLTEQLIYADHFICASDKQRDFWLGALATAGRINGLRWPDASHSNIDELISLVPFGLPDKTPEKNGHGLRLHFGIPLEDFVAVWGGGIYQWFDPLTPIRAIHQLVSKGCRVHLVFMGIKHPNSVLQEHDMCAQAVGLATELGVKDKFVHFNFGWIEYENRQNFFLDADVGISSHFDCPETRFAFRTRMLDYLWCKLPIVATEGDYFAESIKSKNLGLTVEAENVQDWCIALSRLKEDVAFRRQCRQRIGEFSSELKWTTVMHKFAQNIATIDIAKDRDAIRSSIAFGYKYIVIFSRLRKAYDLGGLRQIGNIALKILCRNFNNYRSILTSK